MLARTDGKPPKVDATVEPLVRVAADLRNLPREEFKAQLEIQITGREKNYDYRC